MYIYIYTSTVWARRVGSPPLFPPGEAPPPARFSGGEPASGSLWKVTCRCATLKRPSFTRDAVPSTISSLR